MTRDFERTVSKSTRSQHNQACPLVWSRVLLLRRAPSKSNVASSAQCNAHIVPRIRAVTHKRQRESNRNFRKRICGFGVKVVRTTPLSVNREGVAGKSYELSVSITGIRGNEQLFVSS